MTAAEIAAVLGDARRDGRAWRCQCPLHGGNSLVLRDGDAGRVLVTCWAGCDRQDLLAELRRRGLLDGRLIDDRPRTALSPHRCDTTRDGDVRRIAWARLIWDGAALPGAGSPVVSYFAGRGITLPPSPSLRYSPALRRPDGTYGPAMVARVDGADGRLIGVHRTWLARDADGAWRRRDRASLGPIGGGAVRFGMPRPGEWLAIGEGLETTLAVMQATGLPGWAALSAGGIRALILPPEATHVIICADHDANGVGERAARDAEARWLAEGRRVRIALPPELDTDFADVLAADAYAATEARHVA